MFGFAANIQRGDPDAKKQPRPGCWFLAKDLKAFYNFTSEGEFTDESFAAMQGKILRFAGQALTDPETFDYIDLNPASLLSSRRSLNLQKKTKKPLVITCDNHYPLPEHRETFLTLTDEKKTTPQHILTEKELRSIFSWLPKRALSEAISNAHEVANELKGIRLNKAPMIHFDGDLDAEIERGLKYRLGAGHIKEWTPEYQARLDHELTAIREKEFESYFLIVSDLVVWAKQHMLVGPARGSSAGSLVCYLMRITEVDPLVHNLLFERFIDSNRADLPDIDIDFANQHMVFDHLPKKYGERNVARLGNISRLKSRSVMAECGKRLGIPANDTFAVRNVLIEYSSGDSRYGKGLEDTLHNTRPGKAFMEKYPAALAMTETENHAWHTSVHAAGVLVSNEPVTDYCTVRDGVAQIDKKDSEYLNLLKIDALGLRTLGIIQDAGVIDSETLYGLPLTDQKAFDVINAGRFAGIFQFEGAGQRRVALTVPIVSFRQIDHVTALARPGPLGGGAATNYIDVNDGRKQLKYKHPSMADYLGDTNGVVLYQEQVMKIVREIGKFSWAETSTIRKAMSGRKGIEFFNKQEKKFTKGAAQAGIDAKTAHDIWEEICSFGAWGMNASHTCSYAIISYWCAYLKAHHLLEFSAALLRAAKDDEQTIEILRELNSEGIEYTAFDREKSQVNWSVQDGRIVGGFMNLHGIGPAKATKLINNREGGGFTDKDLETLSKARLKFTELHEAHAKWGEVYDRPEKFNIFGRVKEFAELEDQENAVVLGKIVRKERRDENETVLIAKRGGKRCTGQCLFLDLFVVDDSVSKPVTARVRPWLWHRIGEKIADRARDGEDWFLFRGRWLGQFNMMIVKKARCLTNPEVLE